MENVIFKNISWPLKVAVIFAWFIGVIYVLVFLAGVIKGLMSL